MSINCPIFQLECFLLPDFLSIMSFGDDCEIIVRYVSLFSLMSFIGRLLIPCLCCVCSGEYIFWNHLCFNIILIGGLNSGSLTKILLSRSLKLSEKCVSAQSYLCLTNTSFLAIGSAFCSSLPPTIVFCCCSLFCTIVCRRFNY